MSLARLHIEPAARAITASAAASGEAALMQPVATTPVEQMAGTGTTPNAFDAEIAAARVWALGVYEAIALAVCRRCAAVVAVSTVGFNALDAMNEDNALDLSGVVERS
jgi:hypothetical protein